MPPPAKKTPAKPLTLAQTLAAARKGGSKVGSLTSFKMVTEGLSTGNLTLDAITGCGGLPKGRVVESYGPPSSGKTTAALQAAALVQQQGGRIMFLDHERSLDEAYVRALGIDPDGTDDNGEPTFMYEQPVSFEAGANLFRPMMQWIDLVITDSVALMVTENELAKKTGEVEPMGRAKMMHQYMRQVVGPISRTGTCMVFLNHVQELVDMSPMGQRMKSQGINRTTTPGGVALKFNASLRTAFKQIGNVRSEVMDPITNEMMSLPMQTKTLVTITKNKVGNPFGQAELRVRFGRGFSNEWSALDVLTRHNVLKKATGGIYSGGELTSLDVEEVAALVGPKACGTGANGTWVKGEDNLVYVMERLPKLRGPMITQAIELVGKGWDQKADAETIAAIEAEDQEDGEDETLKPDLSDNPDASELDIMFDKGAPIG